MEVADERRHGRRQHLGRGLVLGGGAVREPVQVSSLGTRQALERSAVTKWIGMSQGGIDSAWIASLMETPLCRS